MTSTTKSTQSWPFFDEIIENISHFSRKPIRFLQELHKLNPFRSKRKDRCIVISDIIKQMIPSMNLSEFQIGYYNRKGNFVSKWSYRELSDATGHSILSIKRAFSDLKKSGYIFIQRCNKTLQNGKWAASTAIKRFSEKFFDDLGISSVWRKQQQYWRRIKDGKHSSSQKKESSHPKSFKQFISNAFKPKQEVSIIEKDYIKERTELDKRLLGITTEEMSPLERLAQLGIKLTTPE